MGHEPQSAEAVVGVGQQQVWVMDYDAAVNALIMALIVVVALVVLTLTWGGDE